jgi:hypothetical protein
VPLVLIFININKNNNKNEARAKVKKQKITRGGARGGSRGLLTSKRARVKKQNNKKQRRGRDLRWRDGENKKRG